MAAKNGPFTKLLHAFATDGLGIGSTGSSEGSLLQWLSPANAAAVPELQFNVFGSHHCETRLPVTIQPLVAKKSHKRTISSSGELVAHPLGFGKGPPAQVFLYHRRRCIPSAGPMAVTGEATEKNSFAPARVKCSTGAWPPAIGSNHR